ncbi:hypothetical protein TSAR_000117 [Trichomalopsis sarcophagae]|uniref:Connector enhancer of kinase suppressor of ras n=1 Tax=Trichomalopsis sarcophagae TaxID=543379 RepID=A0A232F770_9HYME|nr:hypothetical protein TSAR_000117 [Trichomalopsis sarcophagae]
MAYVNVAEWKTDQVCEWLKGLDNSALPYVHSFMNHNVNGQQLLNLRPEDLEHLGVFKLGHQEIILEAVEYLRNFHYELDRENLQLLAMRLSCQAHSLYNELSRQTDSKPVTTQTLSDVVAIITAVKPLVRWLDRPPFSGQLDYNDKKAELLKLSLEMATCAQRDRFAEKPIEEIRTTCGQMAKLADYIIQDVADPMILQPSSLDLATLKKRPGDDLGFCILPSFHGAHQIAEIKFGSAAHQCGKMEEGDEIVQVNYQTVVGWERKNVLELFRESPAEILLTLKRRPRHTKVYGQIYIKPYRLPSNKKTPYATRWQHNLPSPRPELLTIPDFTMPLPRHAPKVPTPEPVSILDTVSMLDTMTTDDSSDSDSSEIEPPSSVRLYSAKPRNLVQRRATITGASPTAKHSVDIEQLWRELKQEHSTSFQLRDKAASCAHGLDNVPSQPSLRPQTCLGIEQRPPGSKKQGINERRKVQFQDGTAHETGKRDQISLAKREGNDSGNTNHQPQASDKASASNESNSKKSDNTVPLEVSHQRQSSNSSNDNRDSTTAPLRSSGGKERGRLDKSHSTPAYDLTESDDDFIEKKFEAALDEHHKQQQRTRAAAGTANGNSSSFYKTDSRYFDSAEESEEHEKMITPKPVADDRELDRTRVIGNVARKIIDIEKNLHNKSNESISEKVLPKPTIIPEAKTNIHIKINDVDIDVNDNLDELEADSGNITTDLDTDEESNLLISEAMIQAANPESPKPAVQDDNAANNNSVESSRESSEDKSESTSSYVEGGMTSSEGDAAMKKFCDIIETIDNALLEQKKLSNGNEFEYENQKQHISLSSDNKSNDYPDNNNQHDKMIEALSPNIQVHKSALVENISIKYPTTPVPSSPSPATRPETPKREAATKPEVKPRLTPPEPPPRKYFTKPAPLNFNVNQPLPQPINNSPRDHYQPQQHSQDKPKVPDRPSVRRDLKKIDIPPEVHPRDEKTFIDNRRKSDRFETYSDFVERSTDFIDEPSTPIQEIKPSTSLVDPYGYTQIPETKEEASYAQPGTSSSIDAQQYKHEYCPQNLDSPDGLCYSRQQAQPGVGTPSSDAKQRSLEKDRTGMVNRAMMVARSMGLHGNSTKSNNSPRSARKRNTILAKRRNVAVKDIAPGDLEGWLTYRSRGAGGAWARAWFIIKDASLYRFKTQTSTKADCLIALSGFTASQATEVKSRKYAFKVYYTGTVFYFAADTEDTLVMWLDAINRATIGPDRSSGIFTETDESDSETKNNKAKSPSAESKPLAEKTFGSLKKLGKKDSGMKDHEMGGASLDRKYLKFLGSRTQNVPVPTAQFRSYRRVLPTSTPSRKPEKMSSPDLQVTIAGSTFYGLNTSHSATDVLSSSQDMGDYRRTTDRSRSSRNQRPEELQGFITLEEFMLSRQEEECQRTANNSTNNTARFTPLNNDHVHFQHRNIADGGPVSSMVQSTNGMIYGSPRNGDDALPPAPPPPNPPMRGDLYSSNHSFDSETSSSNSGRNETVKSKTHKKSWEPSCLQKKKPSTNNNYEGHRPYSPSVANREFTHNQANVVNDNQIGFSTLDYGDRLKPQPWARTVDTSNGNVDFQHTTRRILRNDGHSGSSGDLACHTCSETMQRTKKESSIARNGSFNVADRRRRDHVHPERNWIESLRSGDKRPMNVDNKGRLKNVAQYQPPPMPMSSFEQDGMRAAFEMHLDKANEQKKSTKGLRNFFGNKSPQKPSSLDLPREQQKTLLGSPRLHRALFRDKSSHQRQNSRSGSQSPGDSGISQSLSSCSGTSQCPTFSQSFSSVNSAGEWGPSDTPAPHVPKCMMGGVSVCQKRPNMRHPLGPPTLPYIPPPTSPPPDYPGLEYPPVFEPGTYSLSDASLLRHRGSKNGQNQNFGD